MSVIEPQDFIAMEGQYVPLNNDGTHFYYKNDYQGQFGDVQVTIMAPPPSVPQEHNYGTPPSGTLCVFSVYCGIDIPNFPPPTTPPPQLPVIPYVPPPVPLPACTVPEPGTFQVVFICAVLVTVFFRWTRRMI